MPRTRVRFPEISPHAWEHPADRAALTTLQRVPGLDIVLQKLIGATSERSLRLVALASAVRVSERQFGKIHNLYREALAVLDIKTTPELFVSFNPFINASAIGVERPFIMLNSSLLDTLTDDELLCVLAHELGHVASGHLLYSTLLVMMTRFASPLLMSIPLGNAAVLGIKLALQEWYRKSELSCDRAGLLVVQDPEVAYTLEMKLAGGRHVDQMNINEFFQQAFEYESSGTMVDSVHKVLNMLGETHPFPVLRLVELKKWVDSGEYLRILNGGYATGGEFVRPLDGGYTNREEAAEENIVDAIKAAASKYKDDLTRSQDPLMETAKDVADKAKQMFDSFINKNRSQS